MYWGLGIFFFIAILCVIVGITMMKRRNDYREGDDEMTDAEFRRIEGFDD
jgi:hypothetical protein